MKPTYATHRPFLTTTLSIVALLVATCPVATPFGDNDGGLDLPGMQDSDTGDGSGDTSNQSTSPEDTLGVVSLAGADIMIVETVDPVRGKISLSTDLSVAMSFDTDPTTADQAQATQSTGDGLTAASEGMAVSIQGGITLPAQSPYDRHLIGPADAAASVSLIVVDSDPGASLDAMLDGNVLLDDLHLVSVPTSLDLDEFAGWVAKKAAMLSPTGAEVKVTWVIASIDSLGELHLAAARVSTLGGDIEVITR
jgi:hypothetical protein